MQILSSFLEGWHPEPQVITRPITPDPIARFAALLDTAMPADRQGSAIPPLWHSFFFTDVSPSAALGPDGHPRDGHFLPPIPDRRRMFAGGRFEQRAPFRIGEHYSRTSSLAGIVDKQGRSGASLFVTIRHEYRDGDTVVAHEEEDIVYRRQPAAEAPVAAATPAPERIVREDPQVTPVDEPFLFRFSALTNNAHRIHYDTPYTTAVEGFPGLVVHGPLLALLALEVPRKALPPSLLSDYSFRLVRPSFLGANVEATATVQDSTWRLEAGSAGTPSSLTATAVFREI